MKFKQLIDTIRKTHFFLQQRAVSAVDRNSIKQIGQTLSAQFQRTEQQEIIRVPPSELIGRLSFSQFAELIRLDDALKRAFYEIECIKGNWSVRELKRQITSLYFERSGLSKDKTKLSEYTQNRAFTLSPKDVIQDPFFFEFLGLKDKDIIKESDLEKALLDNLQDLPGRIHDRTTETRTAGAEASQSG